MKKFCCGDVVPGCDTSFTAATEGEILAAVADHARDDHGMSEVADHVVAAVRSRIVTAR